ncbi:apoptosis regulator BAX-like [Anneissia japonica]|uniref:apoptosis regulator BAX-like n=1 Tax=Anneissia japonica TaxID=1529436 RepID=UPI0014258208|nr:apoptosis regulator BAX-like [Anneissia japonica]
MSGELLPKIYEKFSPWIIGERKRVDRLTTAAVISREIAREFISSPDTESSLSRYAETMREIAEKMDVRLGLELDAAAAVIDFGEDGLPGVFSCLNDMLEIGDVNWGRIVIVYMFGRKVAKRWAEKGLEDYEDTVAEYVGEYVATELSGWISERGGWDDFVEIFGRIRRKSLSDLTVPILLAVMLATPFVLSNCR